MEIGVDIGGTKMAAGLVSNGKVIKKVSKPTPANDDSKIVLDRVLELIDEIITHDVTKIGVGVPSIVDPKSGTVYEVVNIPSWKEINLKKILEDRFKIPSFINNDANCFVLGAYTDPELNDLNDIVGVTLGTGVGVGIVANRKLVCGRNNGAGELSGIQYKDSTYENYCSTPFFIRRNTSGKEMAEKAKANDKAALEIWREFGQNLGIFLQTILLAYDPEYIVIGGGISHAYNFFKEGMEEGMSTFPYARTLKNIRYGVTSVPDVSLVGAAQLDY